LWKEAYLFKGLEVKIERKDKPIFPFRDYVEAETV